MNSISTKHVIEKQLPSHVRESNPVLNKFLEYYYEFQRESKIPDIIQEVKKYNDIDETDEKFLTDFFEEFKLLPVDIVSNKRLVAKHIYDLYKSKGSETSLRLLFKIVYGEEIDIQYPSKDILRSSDGVWIQNNVVSLSKIEGEVKITSNRIVFETTKGVCDFDIQSFEYSDDEIIRVTFNPNKKYYVDDNQLVKIYSDNVLDFIGELVVMPSSIDIVNGGEFWQAGQLIVLPGDIDTICQISRVSDRGSIKKVDIIQYGSYPDYERLYSISPFMYAPIADYNEIYQEQIAEYPSVFKQSVNVFDRNYISEKITIDRNSVIEFDQTYTPPTNLPNINISLNLENERNSPYVFTGYVLNNYGVDYQKVNRVRYSEAIINDGITLDQWLTSKARLRVRSDFYAKTAGFYLDNRGQLSASNIRLQDNFFYQLFSYVVTTSRVLSNIRNVIGLVHPSGFKYFIDTKREMVINVNIKTTRTIE